MTQEAALSHCIEALEGKPFGMRMAAYSHFQAMKVGETCRSWEAGKKERWLWEPTEGENDGFPQPETSTWNPRHFISTNCHPVGTPPHTTRAGDPNVTARPAVGPPGYNAGLGMHFIGETKPGPITLHASLQEEESFAGPNIHQEGIRIHPTGKLGLPSTCLH